MKLNVSILTAALLLAVVPALHADTEIHNGHEVVAHQVIIKLGKSLVGPSLGAAIQQLQSLGDADDLHILNGALNLLVLHSKTDSVAALISLPGSHPAVA